MRQPESRAEPVLTLQGTARLFLAAYHLPVHVETGNLDGLHVFLSGGCQVFVALTAPDGQAAYRVQGCPAGEDVSSLVVAAAGVLPGPAEPLTVPHFRERWAAAGHLLLVSTGGWEGLPVQGNVFFGGSRDRDGVYHWNTAECDTDAAGRILRVG
jgi:hypothetical protein